MHKIAWATSKRCAYGKLDIIYANDRKERSTVSHENHRNINILIQILEEFYACLIIIYLNVISILLFFGENIFENTYLKLTFGGFASTLQAMCAVSRLATP